MTKRPRERAGKKFSGNHQRSWLWGHHAVTETITAGRWPVLEIYATQSAYDRSRELLDGQVRRGSPMHLVTTERIEELSRSREHQGLLVRLGPFPYGDMDQLVRDLKEQLDRVSRTDPSSTVTVEEMPLVVMCDRLQDSFNIGAILRCCDGVNVSAVIVGEKAQAEMTSHVARASSGAINHVKIVRTLDLVAAAEQLRSLGLKVYAADSNATSSMWEASLQHPALLIIGSEATGVDERLLNLCDERLVIPMQGHITSLNAAVASGILLYEIRRQQRSRHAH